MILRKYDYHQRHLNEGKDVWLRHLSNNSLDYLICDSTWDVLRKLFEKGFQSLKIRRNGRNEITSRSTFVHAFLYANIESKFRFWAMKRPLDQFQDIYSNVLQEQKRDKPWLIWFNEKKEIEKFPHKMKGSRLKHKTNIPLVHNSKTHSNEHFIKVTANNIKLFPIETHLIKEYSLWTIAKIVVEQRAASWLMRSNAYV